MLGVGVLLSEDSEVLDGIEISTTGNESRLLGGGVDEVLSETNPDRLLSLALEVKRLSKPNIMCCSFTLLVL